MNMKLIAVFTAIVTAASGQVLAQCATGVNTGGGNCVPPDAVGMSGYEPYPDDAPPPPQWQTTWGAIALDLEAVSKGVATNMATKADAVRSAMAECRQNGARKCQITLTYYNQCAAVAWGDRSYGFAKNPTAEGASNDAINQCAKGGSGCSVVYSACSMPTRVN